MKAIISLYENKYLFENKKEMIIMLRETKKKQIIIIIITYSPLKYA